MRMIIIPILGGINHDRLRSVLRLALVLAPLTLLPATALAAEPEVLIVLRDGRFEPAEVRVKAGVKSQAGDR